MIHAQHRVLARDDGFKMMPLPVDKALGHFRWLMNQRVTAEQSPHISA
jgi:hypothetical protein